MVNLTKISNKKDSTKIRYCYNNYIYSQNIYFFKDSDITVHIRYDFLQKIWLSILRYEVHYCY